MDSLGNLLSDNRGNAKDNISSMTVLLWPGFIIRSTFILKLLSGELILKFLSAWSLSLGNIIKEMVYMGRIGSHGICTKGKRYLAVAGEREEKLWGLEQGIAGRLGLCSGQMECGAGDAEKKLDFQQLCCYHCSIYIFYHPHHQHHYDHHQYHQRFHHHCHHC